MARTGGDAVKILKTRNSENALTVSFQMMNLTHSLNWHCCPLNDSTIVQFCDTNPIYHWTEIWRGVTK